MLTKPEERVLRTFNQYLMTPGSMQWWGTSREQRPVVFGWRQLGLRVFVDVYLLLVFFDLGHPNDFPRE